MKNKTYEVKILFIVCFHDCIKEGKDCQIINFIFIFQQTAFTQYHSFNIIKIISKKIRIKRRRENEHHQQPMNEFNNVI